MKKNYLCGYCDEYATLLKKEDDTLTIECVVIPKLKTLIHAYCVDQNGTFIDVRGSFTDKEEFLSYFDVVKHKDKREKYCEFYRFITIKSFVDFLVELRGR